MENPVSLGYLEPEMILTKVVIAVFKLSMVDSVELRKEQDLSKRHTIIVLFSNGSKYCRYTIPEYELISANYDISEYIIEEIKRTMSEVLRKS